MSDSLPDPVRVSPVIRGCRWIMLMLGISYGISKQKFLSIREVGILEEHHKQQKIRNAELKANKEKRSEVEMKELDEMFFGKPEDTDTKK